MTVFSAVVELVLVSTLLTRVTVVIALCPLVITLLVKLDPSDSVTMVATDTTGSWSNAKTVVIAWVVTASAFVPSALEMVLLYVWMLPSALVTLVSPPSGKVVVLMPSALVMVTEPTLVFTEPVELPSLVVIVSVVIVELFESGAVTVMPVVYSVPSAKTSVVVLTLDVSLSVTVTVTGKL